MKRFWFVFVLLSVLIIVVLAFSSALLRRFEGGPVSVAGGVLHWRVDHAYPETRESGPLAQVMQGRPLLAREVLSSLDRAAADPRIEGLMLEIYSLPADWGQIEELSAAVKRFAASGKPAVAWLAAGGSREYSLALAADTVALPPEGYLQALGVSANPYYLKGSLDKLGMAGDFVHSGRYKTAPETWTREEPSEASREVLGALVDDIYARFVERIVGARGVEAAQAEAWIDRGLFSAADAAAAGLVDTVLFDDEVRDLFFAGDDDTDLADYAAALRAPRGAAGIAVVAVEGTIVEGRSHQGGWQGTYAGNLSIAEDLERAVEDDRVDAIVLRVDSPGGSALASDLIGRAVANARARKPLVVSMAGLAASGGYYVGCAADSVFALPSTLTGSVGVYAGKIDRQGFYRKIGVSHAHVRRGENVDLFGDTAPFSPGQRRLLQDHLDAFYDRFVGRVSAARGLPADSAAVLAEGRVWTGAQAVGNGLVDAPGGLMRAAAAARDLAGLPADVPLRLIGYEPELSLLERLLVRALRGASAETPAVELPALLGEGLAALRRAGWLAAVPLLDGRPLVLMPFRLEFS